MNTIAGRYQPYYVPLEGVQPLARQPGPRLIHGHLPLDESWAEFAQARVQEIRDESVALDPGQISTLSEANQEDFSEAVNAALSQLGLDFAKSDVFDGQTLFCRGATFHTDSTFWPNSAFLNWYLAGPSRDFVIPGVGTLTLVPGDVLVFDPARPHALLHVGERGFDASTWTSDAAEEHSIFLSAELDLDERLDNALGIKRGTCEEFAVQGLRADQYEKVEVNKRTGRYVKVRPRKDPSGLLEPIRVPYQWSDEDDFKLLAVRTLGQKVVRGYMPLPEDLATHTAALLAPERAHLFAHDAAGGLACPEDEGLPSHCALDAAFLNNPYRFPRGFPADARPNFQWACCRQVSFHWDDVESEDKAYIIWVLGTSTPMVFHTMGAQYTLASGDVLIFDAQQLHGLLKANATQFTERRHNKQHRMVYALGTVPLTRSLRDELLVRIEPVPEVLMTMSDVIWRESTGRVLKVQKQRFLY